MNVFIGSGSFVFVSVLFLLWLIFCSVEVWCYVGIVFVGVMFVEDFYVFLVSGEGIGNVGIGLVLFDDQQW